MEDNESYTEFTDYYILVDPSNAPLCIAKTYNSEHSTNIDLSYISTHQEQLQNGCAKKMLDHLVSAAQSQGKILTTRGFTESGRHLQRYLDELNTRAGKPVFVSIPGA